MDGKDREIMRIVMVGHVDHGKSTLIGRLFYDTDCIPRERMNAIREKSESQGKKVEFAYLMDAFEEEQNQGITIDTAHTFFKTSKRHYIIIDAPGHKDFLKNMISGASNAEAAILIVDAKEGVQEQTKRHAYILSMLGIRKVVAVINKMDLVGYSKDVFQEVTDSLHEFLAGIEIQPGYTIPISSTQGDNVAGQSERMQWYNGPTILSALDSFTKQAALHDIPLRFPVQDIYKIDDKRLIAGRVESGTIRKGDSIVLSPSEKRIRVSSIEKWIENPDSAGAGECIAITMSEQIFAERGMIASHETDPPAVTDTFTSNIFWMGKKPLKEGGQYLLKLTTQDMPCTVQKIKGVIDSSSLKPLENPAKLENTQVGEIVLKTRKPVACDLFSVIPTTGRFVLVEGDRVAGGGIITGIDSRRLVEKDLRQETMPRLMEHVMPVIESMSKGQRAEILITDISASNEIKREAFEKDIEYELVFEEDYLKIMLGKN